MGNKHKQPTFNEQVKAAKAKDVRTPVASDESEKPTWSFKLLDHGGPWCFTNMTPGEFPEVLERIRNLESMRWSEIHGDRDHAIAVESLSKAAKDRLQEIQQDDISAVYSFHVNGEKRIIGVRSGTICRVLWWDPEHQVCPSQKKHT